MTTRKTKKTSRSFTANEARNILFNFQETLRADVYRAINDHLTNWMAAIEKRPKEAHILFMGVTLESEQPPRRRAPSILEQDPMLDVDFPRHTPQVVPFIHGETVRGMPGVETRVQVLPQSLVKKGCLIICFGARMKAVYLGQRQQDIMMNGSTLVAKTLETSNIGQAITVVLDF